MSEVERVRHACSVDDRKYTRGLILGWVLREKAGREDGAAIGMWKGCDDVRQACTAGARRTVGSRNASIMVIAMCLCGH